MENQITDKALINTPINDGGRKVATTLETSSKSEIRAVITSAS